MAKSIRIEDGWIAVYHDGVLIERSDPTPDNVRRIDRREGSYTHDDHFASLLAKYVGARLLRTTNGAG